MWPIVYERNDYSWWNFIRLLTRNAYFLSSIFSWIFYIIYNILRYHFLIIFAVSSSQWRRMSFRTHIYPSITLSSKTHIYFYMIHKLHARFIHCNQPHRLHSISIFECEWWFATIWTMGKIAVQYISVRRILIHAYTQTRTKNILLKRRIRVSRERGTHTLAYTYLLETDLIKCYVIFIH